MSAQPVILEEVGRQRALIHAIFLSNVVAMLNAGSVNLAMPVFMETFHTSLNQVQWVMIGYVLALTCAMPLVSAFCERFSYRRVFLTALVVMGVFSTLCAVAPSLEVLIAIRIVSGFFSGMLVSLTMALIYRYLPVKERATQYANLLVTQSVAFALGPSFAGLCMQLTNWRIIFVLPALFVIPAFLKASHALPVEPPNKEVKFRIFGVLVVSVATGILLLAFTFLERWGALDPRFLGMILGSLVLLFGAIAYIRRSPAPALDFGLFALPSFALSILLSLVLSTVVGITATMMAVYVQGVRGFVPVYSGLVQMMPALLLAGANLVVKHIYGHFKAAYITAFGFLIAALGNLLMLTVDMNMTLVVLSLILCIRYIGFGFIRMPVADLGMTAVPQARVSHASALINWANQLSQAVSTNILTVLFTWRANVLFRESGGVGEAIAGQKGWNAAALGGFHLVFAVMGGLLLLGAVLALFMGKVARADKARQARDAGNAKGAPA